MDLKQGYVVLSLNITQEVIVRNLQAKTDIFSPVYRRQAFKSKRQSSLQEIVCRSCVDILACENKIGIEAHLLIKTLWFLQGEGMLLGGY